MKRYYHFSLMVAFLIATWSSPLLATDNLPTKSRNTPHPVISGALNLLPIPVDIGHFYNGHWRKGLLFSGIEIAMVANGLAAAAPLMDGRADWTDLSATRKSYLIGSAAGFVVTKVISTWLCVTDAQAIRDDDNLRWIPSATLLPEGGLQVALNRTF